MFCEDKLQRGSTAGTKRKFQFGKKEQRKKKRQLSINTGNRIKQLHEENGLRPRDNKLGWGRIMRKQKAQN